MFSKKMVQAEAYSLKSTRVLGSIRASKDGYKTSKEKYSNTGIGIWYSGTLISRGRKNM